MTRTDGVPRPGTRRFGLGILILAVVSSLLAGAAATVLVMRDNPPGDASVEAGFARDMSTHHDQAVTMGLIAYRDAETRDVRQIGYDIATNQQGQIGMMQQWLRDWDLYPTSSEPPMAWMEHADEYALQGGLMPGMATPEELTALQEADGTEVDRLFLELMIDHHLGGIHMVDDLLAQSDHPQVTWLAQLMKDGQQGELDALQSLLDDLPGEP